MIHGQLTNNCLRSHNNGCFGESFLELQQFVQGNGSKPGVATSDKHHVLLTELCGFLGRYCMLNSKTATRTCLLSHWYIAITVRFRGLYDLSI